MRNLYVSKCPACDTPVPWQRRWIKAWTWARWPCEKCGAKLGFCMRRRFLKGLPVTLVLMMGIVLYFFAKVDINPPQFVLSARNAIAMIPRPVGVLLLIGIGIISVLVPDRVVVRERTGASRAA